jgi:predicted nuclease of predicted toxin-antitoxin system
VKVLVDTCMAGSVAPALAEAGHEVECVVDWPSDPGDAAILAHAQTAGQVVLTLDKDFGELAVVRGQPHSGVVRLVGFSATQQASACVAVLSRYADALAGGALITAEPGRTRVRPKDP